MPLMLLAKAAEFIVPPLIQIVIAHYRKTAPTAPDATVTLQKHVAALAVLK